MTVSKASLSWSSNTRVTSGVSSYGGIGMCVFSLCRTKSTSITNIDMTRLAVVLSNKVFVYEFSIEPRLLYTFETCDNDRGLAAISSEPNHGVLVIPGRQRGHLQIVDLDSLGYQWPSTTTTTAPGSNNEINVNVSIIAAHSGRLSCVALNRDGTKCATASDKGTFAQRKTCCHPTQTDRTDLSGQCAQRHGGVELCHHKRAAGNWGFRNL